MKVDIRIQIKPGDSLFVGGGSGTSGIGVDASTVRRSDGCLIIPGSTFKGKVRNECERIAKALKENICTSPVAENMCPHYFLNLNSSEAYCMICRIFGSPWLESSLKFSDLIWQMPDEISYDEWRKVSKTEVRPGVSLSRYTRAKKEKELFFREIMKTGMEASFEGTIKGSLNRSSNPRRDMSLLIAGLKVVFAIGGLKTRGIGWITLLYSSDGIISAGFKESDFIEELEKWQRSE